MSDKLKPCPFCGGTNLDYDYADLSCPEEIATFVICRKCGSFSSGSNSGNFGAMEAWNTRPLEDKLEAKITAAGDLLEQISVWLWKNQGMPEPMWADQFEAVCRMFEPEASNGIDNLS